jgi:hypothetical protein
MAAGRALENAGAMLNPAAFWVICREDQAPNARMLNRACAHGAWLQRHDQIAFRQTRIAEPGGCLAQCQNLRMRGWIRRGFHQVMGGCDDFALMHNDCADRRFASICGGAGGGECGV